MATPLATYKYKHGQGGIATARRPWILGSLALVGTLGWLLHPFLSVVGLFACGVAALATRPKEVLRVGPRYLLAGSRVLYYRKVLRVERHLQRGTLSLYFPGGHSWTLERDRFPTNARKTPKIAANKAKKFQAISDKLLAKIQRANPEVELRELG